MWVMVTRELNNQATREGELTALIAQSILKGFVRIKLGGETGVIAVNPSSPTLGWKNRNQVLYSRMRSWHATYSHQRILEAILQD